MQIPHHVTDEQAQHDQMLNVLGNFTGTLAHEINNQLTVVSGYCHLLLAQLPPNDARRDAVQAISEANQRITQWTRRMQAMSGRQYEQREPVNLNDLVAQWASHHSLSDSRTDGVKIVRSDSELLVQADSTRLHQWLDDLIQFARRAADPCPPLTIVLSRRDVSLGEPFDEMPEVVVLEVVLPTAIWPRGERWDPLQPDPSASDSQRKLELGLLMLAGAARHDVRFVCRTNLQGETSFGLVWPVASKA